MSTPVLQQWESSQDSPEIPVNENFRALEHQAVYAIDPLTTSGLVLGYCGGRWGGFDNPAGTLALTDDDSNYYVVAVATGVASISTSDTNWNDLESYRRVYLVPAADGVVDPEAIEDHRAGPGGVHGPGVGYGPNIAAIDALTSAADRGIQFTGAGTAATFVLTAAGKALLDDADASTQRTTLGLGTAALLASDTDTTLAANSDTRVATQKATKSYIDSVITGGAVDVMLFKGVIDCSANPNYPAADAGNLYKVSVAGKIGGGSGPSVEAGDTLYCITDSSAAANHATVGANWVIAQVNVDGAVTYTGSAVTSGSVVVFSGTTGKVVAERTLSQLAGDLRPDLKPTEWIPIACSDEATALTSGTAKVTFRMPYGFTVTAVRASLTTAQASGSIFTVDVNEAGTTILSTKLTIDNTEKTSTTAATAAVISDASLADDAEMTIDIDQVGDGTAKGLKVYLIGYRT